MRILIIIASLFIIAACSGLSKAEKARLNTTETTAINHTGHILLIDTSTATIRFTGHGVGQNHSGIFKLSEGKVWIENKTITGGAFTINIPSMQLEEKGALIQNKLKPHLLSADFFNAAAYPTAAFNITKAEALNSNNADMPNYLITGNLTLKGITKNISFPAKLQITDSILNGVANFTINRSWWHINYGNDKSLGNRFISEVVNIQLHIQTNP